MRFARIPRWGISVLAALVMLQSCCDEHELEIGDLEGQMSFGFDFAADVEFDWDMELDFSFNWSGWAKIDAATNANIDFDWTGMLAFETTTVGDVDDDGVSEDVNLVALAQSDPSEPETVFVAWRGDQYSYDQDTCYLLWWEGDTIELLSAGCDAAEPAVHCVMTRGDAGSLDCEVCNQQNQCTDCSTGEAVADCMSTGENELPGGQEPPSGASGAAGRAGAAGAAGEGGALPGGGGTGNLDGGVAGAGGVPSRAGAGGAAILAGGGGVDSQGGSTTVSVQWSLCLDQVRDLANQAQDCGMQAPLDADLLCTDRMSDVDLCVLAVEAAGLFGSTCAVLGEDLACGRLFS